MRDIKMSELLSLPVKREPGGVMPYLKDANGEVIFVGDGYHIDAIVIAINTHDTLAAQNLALKSLLSETKAILETSSAVTDTVWYNDHTTMCDKIQLTLEGVGDE